MSFTIGIALHARAKNELKEVKKEGRRIDAWTDSDGLREWVAADSESGVKAVLKAITCNDGEKFCHLPITFNRLNTLIV